MSPASLCEQMLQIYVQITETFFFETFFFFGLRELFFS